MYGIRVYFKLKIQRSVNICRVGSENFCVVVFPYKDRCSIEAVFRDGGGDGDVAAFRHLAQDFF